MRNIKMGPKLIASYMLITIVSVAVCVYLLFQLSDLDDSTDNLYDKGVLPLTNVIKTARMVQMMRLSAYQVAIATTKEDRAIPRRTMDSLRNEILAIYAIEETRLMTEKSKMQIEEIRIALENYVNEYRKFANDIDYGLAPLYVVPTTLRDLATIFTKKNSEFVETKTEAAQNISERAGELYDRSKEISIILLVIMAIGSIGIGIAMTFSITRPLNKVVSTLKKGESGDLRARCGVDQEDEIGIVAKATDGFFAKIQGMIKGINDDSRLITKDAEELSSVSRELASGAEETVNQSNTVASTTEQMAVNINAMASGAEEASVNANEVAGAAEQMSTNMSTIAAAIEQMSASISQIAGNTSEVRKVATEATDKAVAATEVMSKLGQAAKEIGQVTEVIKKIADKTNLLALNATIEAASAGEAGKGFAVVAGEIKELATQSAKSADDIASRIENIQSGTSNAVTVIGDVSEIIGKINESVEAIAGHVDQQTKASNEIASNVAQANTGAKRVASAIGEVAKGTTDVSRNAGEAARGASNVSSNAVGMNQVAKGSAEEAAKVSHSAVELDKVAEELNEMVDKFKV